MILLEEKINFKGMINIPKISKRSEISKEFKLLNIYQEKM
jgi:hypothetical protein